MQDESRIPKTARDAYLIELLGDLGIVHDLVKSLPDAINQATSGSVEIIANAVEEAEKTALELSRGVQEQKELAISGIDAAIKQAIESHAKSTFSAIDKNVNEMQERINKFELADPKSRRLNYILSFALVITLILSTVAIAGIYSGAKSRIDDLDATLKDLNMQVEAQLPSSKPSK